MSGLILIEIDAGDPMPSAIFSILYSSDSDSTLKDKMPLLIPCCISLLFLPTPEKIIFFGSAPIDRSHDQLTGALQLGFPRPLRWNRTILLPSKNGRLSSEDGPVELR